MMAYDSMRMTWLPHVMYMQEPNFRSAVVNTDSYGFRYSADSSGRSVGFDTAGGPPTNILVGNSTAFGVGASNDGGTLASALGRYSTESWLNFSGRSFSSTQELLLFEMYFSELQNTKRIVIFSGANNLVLHHRSPFYPSKFGSFFYWRQYELAMLNEMLTPNRRRLKALLHPIFGDRIDYATIPARRLIPAILGLVPFPIGAAPDWPSGRSPRVKADVAAWMERDLRLWRIFADAVGAQLLYVLQPLGNWVKKGTTQEEQALFNEMASSERKFARVLAHELDSDAHRNYTETLISACKAAAVDFFDMNVALSAAGLDGHWIFNDYIHLTDEGYDVVGKLIVDRLGVLGSSARPLSADATPIVMET